VLVRPDGYVAWAQAHAADDRAVARALRQWCTPADVRGTPS